MSEDLTRKRIRTYLSQAKPLQEKWTETRKVIVIAGTMYQITDNWPRWTTSDIISLAKDIGGEIREVEVTVTLDVSVREEVNH